MHFFLSWGVHPFRAKSDTWTVGIEWPLSNCNLTWHWFVTTLCGCLSDITGLQDARGCKHPSYAALRQWNKIETFCKTQQSIRWTHRYSQLKKLALAVAWACVKFRTYITELKVVVQTDHDHWRVFQTPKVFISCFHAYVFAWYSCGLVMTLCTDQAASLLLPVCSLVKSANPVNSLCLFRIVCRVFCTSSDQFSPCNITQTYETCQALEHDEVSQAIFKFCQNGWPQKVSDNLKPYFSVRCEITCAEGLLLSGCRLIIPTKLWNDVITRIHNGHQGILKCCSRAYSSVWWPRFNDGIKNYVSKCHICQK